MILAHAAALIVMASSPASTCAPPSCLPIPRALSRALVSARAIARLHPLPVDWFVGNCRRPGGSRKTVDCTATFRVQGKASCNPSSLTIRVRYRPHSRKTVASYPHDPVCLG